MSITTLTRVLLMATFSFFFSQHLHANCLNPANPIVAENCLTGTSSEDWDIVGSGDPGIQGFATDMSVNKGGRIDFKITSDSSSFKIDVYRIGFYQGLGARKVHTISNVQGTVQPACITDAVTRLADCGNWSVSASWNVPDTAVSGVYIARLVRPGGNGASHIIFIVRDDQASADIVYQTSDTTWQAYNEYGGQSLYGKNFDRGARAYKVSYNRPITTRGWIPRTFFFSDEYPMVRWLEANGYRITYISGVDTHRSGSSLLNPSTRRMFISSGHDEYWSATQRANVESARDRGLNLAFFTGNGVYWKIRWENSIDGSGTPHRTMVCYKETIGDVTDPSPEWTGTWRDPRGGSPSDAGKPENALTGTLFIANGLNSQIMKIPAAFGRHRFWRNTSIASLSPGSEASLPFGVLGYEWDYDADNGFRPAGLAQLSSTTVTLAGQAAEGAAGYPYSGSGTYTHSMTLYRVPSGARVFGSGTIYWSWGLDEYHDSQDGYTVAPDIRMKQATVNLFADMGVQPGRLEAGLAPALASTDLTPPVAVITSQLPSTVQAGSTILLSGTASDQGGIVAGVEVSVDGGATWAPATGRDNWTFTWRPALSTTASIRVRAVDDSGNLQQNTQVIGVAGGAPGGSCPCNGFGSATPEIPSFNDPSAVELGVKFQVTQSGLITGLRFFKGPGNGGTHTGRIWSINGAQISTPAVFTNETATGWQEVRFLTPVAVSPNTTYVASYHAPQGGYAFSNNFFTSNLTSGPVVFLSGNNSGGNGVFSYGPSGTFPVNGSTSNANYWVDVIFESSVTPSVQTLITGFKPDDKPANEQFPDPASVVVGVKFQVTKRGFISALRFFKGQSNTGTHIGQLWTQDGVRLGEPATFTNETSSGWQQVNLARPIAVSPGTTYIASYSAPNGRYAYDGNYFTTDKGSDLVRFPASTRAGGNGVFTYGPSNSFPRSSANSANYWVDVVFSEATSTNLEPTSVFPPSARPTIESFEADSSPVQLGVKFQVAQAGVITGLRFYKGFLNTGSHTARIWTAAGASLGTPAVFQNESSSGWQQVNFASPIDVVPGTTYIASYHAPNGRYSFDANYFGANVSNGPVTFLRSVPSDGNGVYAYGAEGTFPVNSANSANYWIDVVFQSSFPAVSGADRYSTTQGQSLKVGRPGVLANDRADFGSLQSSLISGPTNGSVTLNPDGSFVYTPSPSFKGQDSFLYQARNGETASAPTMVSIQVRSNSCPCSLFESTASRAIPPQVPASDASSVEVGFKFQVLEAGTITGLRFFKAAQNTGEHVGNLWTSTGLNLAKGTFINETASGWQQLQFAQPVQVVPGTTYVASYFAPKGNYSFTSDYFSFEGFTNGPITAPAASVVNGNGVFNYSTASSFPGNTSNLNANYWVDVSFRPAQTSSLWSLADRPVIPSFPDNAQVEVGLRFRTSVAGWISGVRFFKGSGNTGIHTATLWTTTGEKLASVEFLQETPTGWQQVTFGSAVPIQAGKDYIISYNAPKGNYALDRFYFRDADRRSGPLTAPRDRNGANNGLFIYGPVAFPVNTFNSNNYWVDVEFQPAP